MPLGAALPAIIGAAGSIGGGLLARKSGLGGPSPQQNELTNEQLINIRKLRDISSGLMPQGQNLLDLSRSTFQAPLNYWTGLAGGTRTGATSLLAPEISRINEGEEASRRTLMDLYPRSGASPDIRAGSVFAPQRAISTLLQSARPTAINELSTLGGKFADIGTNLTRTGIGALEGGTAAGSRTLDDLMRQQFEQRLVQEQFGGAMGNILYQIVKGLQAGKGGGGSVTGVPDVSGLPSGIPGLLGGR